MSALRHHDPLRSNASIKADVQEVHQDGRRYLVFPLIALREMVIDYPENNTRELLTKERIQESKEMWAGTPLTYIHPDNRQKTADKPEAFTGEVIGQAYEPSIVSGEKLRVQAWLDIEKALDIGGLAADVVHRLQAGEELSVSAGYATMDDEFTRGTFNGDDYDVKQGMLIPDHIAIFPSDEFNARMTKRDGVGAPRANAIVDRADADSDADDGDGDDQSAGASAAGIGMEFDEEPDPATFGEKVLNALGITTDAPSDDADSESADGDDAGADPAPETDDDATAESSPDDDGEESASEEPDADDDPDGAAADDEPAEESPDDHDTHEDAESADVDADEDGDADADADADSPTTMKENSTTLGVEKLAEHTPFSPDTLESMDDDHLASVEADVVEALADADDESESEADAQDETEPESETETSADANEEEMETDQKENFVTKDEFAELKGMVEGVAETLNEKENAQKREKAEIVANATDVTADEAMEMPESALEKLADEHREERKANYGAVPGTVDRTPDRDAEYEDYPAGGRSAWKKRREGDN